MNTGIKRNFKGLRMKIFLVSALCMLVPMVFVAYTARYISGKFLTEYAKNSLMNIASEKRNQFDIAFADIIRQGQSIVKQPAIVDPLKSAKINSVVPSEPELQKISQVLQDNFELGDGLYENIYLMYNNKVIADGIGGTSIGWENEEVGSAKELLNREAIASPTTGRPVKAIVVPIKSDDMHLGTIGMAIELNNVSGKIIDSNSSADTTKTFVLNTAGLVLASTDPEYVFALDFQSEESGLQDLFSQIRSEGTGTGYFTLNGIEYIAAYCTSKYGMYILSYSPVDEYMAMIYDMRNIILIITLCSIIITAIVIIIFSGSITKPIHLVSELAELLAGGDLSAEIPEKFLARKDELGRLSNSFAAMIRDLKTMITKLAATADQVAASSQELYASGEQVGKAADDVGKTILEISSGAEEQSRQIGSALANLSNLIGQINEVKISTDVMDQTTVQIIEDIGKGSTVSLESVNRINALKAETEDVSKVIFSLGDISDQIGNITELISGIAQQTNMLALNATIEAARAGEAGRGFSVVAAQIRKLAEETADASKSIAKLVTDIRNGVEIAINKIDNSVKTVSDSVKAIEQNRDIFSEINSQAERFKEIVAKVTENVNIMTENSYEFESIMQDINRTSGEFAANAESVSAATEEQVALTSEIVASSKALAELAEELLSLIRNFKL